MCVNDLATTQNCGAFTKAANYQQPTSLLINNFVGQSHFPNIIKVIILNIWQRFTNCTSDIFIAKENKDKETCVATDKTSV